MDAEAAEISAASAAGLLAFSVARIGLYARRAAVAGREAVAADARNSTANRRGEAADEAMECTGHPPLPPRQGRWRQPLRGAERQHASVDATDRHSDAPVDLVARPPAGARP